jgi:predicted SnoaL-like aldol condensation-catalyzing enzyme
MKEKKFPKIEITEHLQENWTQQERENAETVVDFFQHLMNEHDFEYIAQTYSGGTYTQHNRSIPNGMAGLIDYVKTLTGRFPDYSFDVKRIVADGEFVILHSHTTMRAKDRGNEQKGFIITDTFRLKDGKLAEHWDAIQPVDLFSRILFLVTGGSIKNNNPTF